MQSLIIAATQYTPDINLNAQTGILEIRGKSYPENTFEFYMPLMQWIEDYFNSTAAATTVVNMEILYFNSSSSKLFFDLFDLFLNASKQHSIEINWIYDKENESAEEAGEDFCEDFKTLNIRLIAKEH